jgi:hypothetical protein
MSNKLDSRDEGLVRSAACFQALMEHNDKLRALIEHAVETEDSDDLHAVVECAAEFQAKAAEIIGQLAMIVGHVDNTSPSIFLGTVAGMMVECECEHDPMTLLRGLLGD